MNKRQRKQQQFAVGVIVASLLLNIFLFGSLLSAQSDIAMANSAVETAQQQLANTQAQLRPLLEKANAQAAEEQARDQRIATQKAALDAPVEVTDEQLVIAQQLPGKVAALQATWDVALDAGDYEGLQQAYYKVMLTSEDLLVDAEYARDFIIANEVGLQKADVDTKALLFNLESGLAQLKGFPVNIELDLDARGLEVF